MNKNFEYWLRYIRIPFTAITGAVFLVNNKNAFLADEWLYWFFIILGLIWVVSGVYIDSITAFRILSDENNKPKKKTIRFPLKIYLLIVLGIIFWLLANFIYSGQIGRIPESWRFIIALLVGLLGIVLVTIGIVQANNLRKQNKAYIEGEGVNILDRKVEQGSNIFLKKAEQIEIKVTASREIVISQAKRDNPAIITITNDQFDQVIKWLNEAKDVLDQNKQDGSH